MVQKKKKIVLIRQQQLTVTTRCGSLARRVLLFDRPIKSYNRTSVQFQYIYVVSFWKIFTSSVQTLYNIYI